MNYVSEFESQAGCPISMSQKDKSQYSVSKAEVRRLLKEARLYEAMILSRGEQLPPPTKDWSMDSVETLTIALGAKNTSLS